MKCLYCNKKQEELDLYLRCLKCNRYMNEDAYGHQYYEAWSYKEWIHENGDYFDNWINN